MKNGTGLSCRKFDAEKRYVGIDFSGIEENEGMQEEGHCFRNDASIFFYASSSYFASFHLISQQIDKAFEKAERKTVERLILPYYFNFRHYLELELKALIIGLTDESPNISHDLMYLWKEFSKRFSDLEYDSDQVLQYKVTQDSFEKQKSKILCVMAKAEIILKEYVAKEPNVEYYRFIFDTKMELKNPIIELDFPDVDKELRELAQRFKEIKLYLREIIYLYFSVQIDISENFKRYHRGENT